MPEFEGESIYIYPDDFLSACNDREVNEVVDWLRTNDILPTLTIKSKHTTLKNLIFNESLSKIQRNQDFLTLEEQHIIEKIAQKYDF